MKKLLFSFLIAIPVIALSQKKENGTIYREHPALAVVEAYNRAISTADTNNIGSFLADDFVAYNASGGSAFEKGLNKSAFLKRMKAWREGIDYFSLKTSKGTYPDALEYKDPNEKDVVWVQTWDDLKGVNKQTGVKVDMFLHRLISVDKNNKIKKLFIYDNPSVYDEINASLTERKNGTIYNHHEYINKVRNMLHAFENKDFEKSYGYYDAKARFFDINSTNNNSASLDETKAQDKKILDAFDIVGLEQIGYPDYMHYELNNSDIVYSWWRWHLVRKSDKKEISFPIHFEHDFNKEGKIIREIAYYNAALLK
ncbi:MAG TPA: hypothetical protein VEZ55_00830 [Chitinophagaceae bacterium]|nr:hypothetical protein [Chitinophagaceae bacterium]